MAATMPQLDADENPELDARALTEYMTVLEDGDVRARSSPDLYTVTTESGSTYLVDASLSACECADHEYRDRTCKHLRRVAFATGRREVPEWADEGKIDPQLGIHVDEVEDGRDTAEEGADGT